MSRTLGPILNPMVPEAVTITLDRRAFLSELFKAALLSLPLPMVSLAGVYFYLHNSDVNLIGLIVSVVTISGLTGIPLIFYASLRLNAATLARERVYSGALGQLIHKPLEGPLLLRRSIVAGSVKSRALSMFPMCIGFGLEFVLMSYLTGGGGFFVFYALTGAMLAVQAMIAAKLLR